LTYTLEATAKAGGAERHRPAVFASLSVTSAVQLPVPNLATTHKFNLATDRN